MSTRCQIQIEGEPIKIYKHCDGYPNGEHGVLATLQPFVDFFLAKRGWDSEYLLAQIVREFARADAADMVERLESEEGDRYGFADMYRTTGWGLGLEYHGDIEYLYTVKKDGRITVRSGGNLPREAR